jgi:hypothetical protein
MKYSVMEMLGFKEEHLRKTLKSKSQEIANGKQRQGSRLRGWDTSEDKAVVEDTCEEARRQNGEAGRHLHLTYMARAASGRLPSSSSETGPESGKEELLLRMQQ